MAKAKITSKRRGEIFERREKKYLIDEVTYNRLFSLLKKQMIEDNYGLHTINTVYYDTDDFKIIRKSIENSDYKEKLRLRSYGTPRLWDKVYLELKKKLNGVTYKRRIALTLDECEKYLSFGEPPSKNGQIFDEIDWFIKQNNFSPKVLISYDRVAVYGIEDPDFRVTFDMNVRWRENNLDLADGDYGKLLLDKGTSIMEIKTMGSLPIWLTDILSELEIFPISFSKYGNIYKWYLAKKEVVQNVG